MGRTPGKQLEQGRGRSTIEFEVGSVHHQLERRLTANPLLLVQCLYHLFGVWLWNARELLRPSFLAGNFSCVLNSFRTTNCQSVFGRTGTKEMGRSGRGLGENRIVIRYCKCRGASSCKFVTIFGSQRRSLSEVGLIQNFRVTLLD